VIGIRNRCRERIKAHKGRKPKTAISLFLDGPTVKVIDKLIERGHYSSRSEAVRDMVRKYIEIKGLGTR